MIENLEMASNFEFWRHFTSQLSRKARVKKREIVGSNPRT